MLTFNLSDAIERELKSSLESDLARAAEHA